MLCLGVILIINAFSSNLFQTIFYYMPSLGIPLGSIIVQKRTGAGRGKSAYCVIMWKTFGLNSLDQRAFFSKCEYQES